MTVSAKRWASVGIVLLVVVFVVLALVLQRLGDRVAPSVDYAAKVDALVRSELLRRDPLDQSTTSSAPNALQEAHQIATDVERAVDAVLSSELAASWPRPDSLPQTARWPADFSSLDLTTSDEATRTRVRSILTAPDVASALERTAVLPNARGMRTLAEAPSTQAPLFAFAVPPMSPPRELCRIMTQHMELALWADAGPNWPEVVTWYERTLALGRLYASQATQIDRLVGIAIITAATNALQQVLRAAPSKPDDAALLALEQAFVRQLGIDDAGDPQRLPTAALSLETERLSMLDAIQWTHTDDGAGDGRLVPAEVHRLANPNMMLTPGQRIANMLSFITVSRKEATDITNQMFDTEISRVGMNAQDVLTLPSSTLVIDATADSDGRRPARYYFFSNYMSSLSHMRSVDQQFTLHVRAHRVVLALERFRAREGALPAQLAELVPTHLPRLPDDPFSTLGLRYRRSDDGTCVLYSAGMDNQDNAGQEASAAQRFTALRSSAEGEGRDFVLWRSHAD